MSASATDREEAKTESIQLWSSGDAADYLGVRPNTLHYHVSVGNVVPDAFVMMKSKRISLFSKKTIDELQEFLRPDGSTAVRGKPRHTDRKK